MSILKEADGLVNGPRQNDYGHPADDYRKTAEMWEAILRGIPGVSVPPGSITPRIACLMMAAVKISREINAHKRDNLVDLAGYAACAEMCAEREFLIRASYCLLCGTANESDAEACSGCGYAATWVAASA